MSLVPNYVNKNYIQVALERGVPMYLVVLGKKGFPIQTSHFELSNCSHCTIERQRDRINLLELDRVVRPGVYFAYSSPLLWTMWIKFWFSLGVL
ncbi:hypothetical protein KY289_030175 [Solanum tuberosum]|nr:hypothetical protein KY289_030175 [Solanum tuberosum]